MITKLTPEQEAKTKEYEQRYIAYGRATGPCDRVEAEKWLRKIYENAKLEQPNEIIWAKSVKNGNDIVNKLLGNKDKKVINDFCGGQHDVSWIAYYSFFRNELGVEGLDEIVPFDELAKLVCWFWVLDEAAVISERPVHLALNNRGQLHCADDMAIRFADGFGIYAWNGLSIPAEYITKTEQTITLKAIKKENNAELRRTMMEIRGFDWYIEETGATRVAKDEYGELFKIDDKEDPFLICKVKNSSPETDGSYKDYFLSAHPEARPILSDDGRLGDPQELTPRNVIASLFGMTGEQYAPRIET